MQIFCGRSTLADFLTSLYLNSYVATKFEYLEKRDRLQSPSEQARLLDSIPKVIPETSVLESNSEDIDNDVKSEEDSPRSILQCNSTTVHDGWQKKGTLGMLYG